LITLNLVISIFIICKGASPLPYTHAPLTNNTCYFHGAKFILRGYSKLLITMFHEMRHGGSWYIFGCILNNHVKGNSGFFVFQSNDDGTLRFAIMFFAIFISNLNLFKTNSQSVNYVIINYATKMLLLVLKTCLKMRSVSEDWRLRV